MKIARKPIYAQQDCFDASEHKGRQNSRVRIARHRNTVLVDISCNSHECRAEITVHQLAWLLRHADKLTNEHS